MTILDALFGGFQEYRKWRLGKWARVTGYFSGYRWVRLPKDSAELGDEEHHRGVSWYR